MFMLLLHFSCRHIGEGTVSVNGFWMLWIMLTRWEVMMVMMISILKKSTFFFIDNIVS